LSTEVQYNWSTSASTRCYKTSTDKYTSLLYMHQSLVARWR